MSSRVKGAADSLMALKPPLKQAAPLKSDIVYSLESLIFQIKDTHLKVILGHQLFCIYACSRFGDSVEMTDLTISHSGEFCLVEAFTKRYKMGNSEKKRQFLPLVALGRCLYYPKPWAVEWFEARDAELLHDAKFTMPAWSESSSRWIHRLEKLQLSYVSFLPWQVLDTVPMTILAIAARRQSYHGWQNQI